MCIPCSLDSGWPGEKGGRKPGSPRTSSLGELREDGGVGLETGMRKCMPDPRDRHGPVDRLSHCRQPRWLWLQPERGDPTGRSLRAQERGAGPTGCPQLDPSVKPRGLSQLLPRVEFSLPASAARVPIPRRHPGMVHRVSGRKEAQLRSACVSCGMMNCEKTHLHMCDGDQAASGAAASRKDFCSKFGESVGLG